MIRLLIANFARIKKSRLFWCLCGFSALASLALIINALSFGGKEIDGAVTAFVIPLEIAVAVFASFFCGSEYSDGTIRNKLIVGHDRKIIYFANLITTIVCTIAFFASYMLPVLLVGLPCLGLPAETTVKLLAVGVVTLIAFCALFTMVSMIYANKAGSTAVNLVLAFVLVVIAVLICSLLSEPEFYPAFGMDGGVDYVRNPSYVSGAKRVIMQIFADILPAGQAVQFVLGVTSPLWVLPLYSAGVCAVCTVAGMLVFNRKNVK